MARLSQLHPITGTENRERKADLIFVHGLGGDAFDTWSNKESFWPEWIGSEFPEVGVWTLAYAASPTKWLRILGRLKKSRDAGHAMSLPDRARQVLDLLGQHDIGERPIMFICHSLGGLLVKQILRASSDATAKSTERNVAESTRAVLFLATPHSGSRLATLLKNFKVAFPTLAIDDLKEHDTHLRDLYEWYRNNTQGNIQTRTYFESRNVRNALLIVNPTSAHPGVGESPVALDEDHISIAKPLNRTSQVYIGACKMLREHVLIPRLVREYQKDMDTLTKLSHVVKEDLADFSRIRIGESEIKIKRKCVQEIRYQIEEQSIVIVGDPGSGKSGVLNDLVDILFEEGRDTVFLAVDRIVSETESQLRDQFKLEHDLNDILEKWIGDEPAFLVIDALDAARSDKVAQMLMNLLTRVIRNKGRWRVVTSVRKFDLRHSRKLRNVFYGKPPLDEYKDTEFVSVRHVQVPGFTKDELEEVINSSAQFKLFFQSADYNLRQLLRVPFNLRLMGELVGEGVPVPELTPIRTQLELLDRYWEERVILPHDGQRDSRENVLQLAVSEMIKNRTLRVPRTKVVKPNTSTALDQILSEQVLVEWQPSLNARPDETNLAFSHHVLFDYAVERLMFREGDVVQCLASDSELVLVARPSLDMHFQKIWSLDESRNIFWELIFKVVKDKKILEVGKLIGPFIAARSCSKLQDLHPFIQAIENPSEADVAEAVLRHIIQSLLAMNPEDKVARLVGMTAGPWTELVKYLSLKISQSKSGIVCMLLIELCEHFERMTDDQQNHIGVASRNLLEFTWNQEPSNEWLIMQAITCVCRTYASNPDTSSFLLRRILQKENLEKYGYKDIPQLASEIKNIITCDPIFVRDLYVTAFSHVETSRENTHIGGGRIFSFTSNRRQDYDGGLYQLGSFFNHFIEEAPFEAVEALIKVIEIYSLTEHNHMSDIIEEDFLFDGKTAVICTDYSYLWDTGELYHHDQPLKMLNVFQEYLSKLSMDPNQSALQQKLTDLLIAQNKMAVLWRRLLICGAKAPATLGLDVRFLAFSLPVLKCSDTNTVIGEYLNAVYSYLTIEDREKVEQVILSLPSVENTAYAEKTRDRLLGYLPSQHIYTTEAKKRITELDTAGGATKERSPIIFTEWESDEDTDLDRVYLIREGIPIDDLAHGKIYELHLNSKNYIEEYRNVRPSLEKIINIQPVLHELWNDLQNAESNSIHPKLSELAWTSLSGACATSTTCNELKNDNDLKSFLLTILLEAAKDPEPRVNSKSDEEFGSNGVSWVNAPRIEAARGLIELAYIYSTPIPSEIPKSLNELIVDPVPSVRYQIVIRLLNLYKVSETLMWKLIDDVVSKETNSGVLHSLVQYVFVRLASNYPERIHDLSHKILKRTRPEDRRLRRACIELFKGLYIRYNHRKSEVLIRGFISDPISYSEDCHTLVAGLRDTMDLELDNPEKGDQGTVQRRTWDLLLQVLQEIGVKRRSLVSQTMARGSWSEEEQQQVQNLDRIVDTASMEVYFSSGAHNYKRSAGSIDSKVPDPEVQRHFFITANEVLDVLADFSIARVTHHLLEILEYLIPIEPASVFLRIGRTISVGRDGGYQYESLAIGLVVELVEHYLAEYREIFRDSPDCRRTLLELLDVFVKAGWPQARSLTYRIDEIFR